MTPELKQQDKLIEDVLEVLTSNGSEGIRPVLESLLNEAMKAERSEFLKAAPYERTSERIGHANGFKDKTILTRVGPARLKVPQVRGLNFYPQSLERGSRSERALKLAIAEMYVMGVSTRKVTEITEALCGTEVSSSQVSRISKILDEELEKFRNRPLGEYPYVILDARYEKVRYEGMVRDLAVLIAVGINTQGKPEVIGVSVSISEAEVHWKKFLNSLSERGLSGVLLITSDDHTGLRTARTAVFPSIPWQRCQFHLAQNAQSYAPHRSMKEEIGQAMRDIFNCRSLSEAQAMKRKVISEFEERASDFTEWLSDNVDEGFTAFSFPRSHQRKIRTSNWLERANKEIKRRTRVATLFPNVASCLRLVTAILTEMNEEWLAGNIYVNMNDFKKQQEKTDSRIYRKNVA